MELHLEPQGEDHRWYYPLTASPLDAAAAYRYELPNDGVSTVVVLAGSTGWVAEMVSSGATTWDEIFDDCDRFQDGSRAQRDHASETSHETSNDA